jgi:hypothetical protein
MAPERPGTDLRASPALLIPVAELHCRFSRSPGTGGHNVKTIDSRVSWSSILPARHRYREHRSQRPPGCNPAAVGGAAEGGSAPTPSAVVSHPLRTCRKRRLASMKQRSALKANDVDPLMRPSVLRLTMACVVPAPMNMIPTTQQN